MITVALDLLVADVGVGGVMVRLAVFNQRNANLWGGG